MPLGRRIVFAAIYVVAASGGCWLLNFGYVAGAVYLANERRIELPDLDIWMYVVLYIGIPALFACLALAGKLPGTKLKGARGFDVGAVTHGAA